MSTITTIHGTQVIHEDVAESISELISRSQNGIDVALLWWRGDDTAVVVVVDHPTGEALVLDVHEDDNALDMFHHPYAYAAHRHIDHGWPAFAEDSGIAA